MKPKHRLNWMSWHALLACFFLPMMLLYTVTGSLHLLDIKGENYFEDRVAIHLEQDFPELEADAYALLTDHYDPEKYGPIKGQYYRFGGGHSWYHFDQEIIIAWKRSGDAELQVFHHGLWKKLLLIHKGHAHIVFWVLGLALGLSLIFSLLSGVVLAFSTPRYKKTALASVIAGVVVMVVAYFLPL